MKIGDHVKVVRNDYADYGKFLNCEGKIIAGGAKFQSVRRWLVEFSTPHRFALHVIESDLEVTRIKESM